jgi:hypothetical protein
MHTIETRSGSGRLRECTMKPIRNRSMELLILSSYTFFVAIIVHILVILYIPNPEQFICINILFVNITNKIALSIRIFEEEEKTLSI